MIAPGVCTSKAMTTTLDLAPSAQVINALAKSWSVKNPDLKARIFRAVALVANVQPGDRSPNVFFVEGSSGRRYMVKVNRAKKSSSCTCEDHTCRGMKCKHILASALFEKGREMEVC